MFGSRHSCHGCAAEAPVAACDSCGSASAPAVEGVPAQAPAVGGVVVPPAAAPAAAPKKMPDAPKVAPAIPKGDKAVRYEQTPEAPLSIPTTASPVLNNNRSAVIVAPATLRNPF